MQAPSDTPCHVIVALLLLAAAAAQALPQEQKRGTGYDFHDVNDLVALHRLSWTYNWAVEEAVNASAYAREHNIEFVPMQVRVCAWT